MSLIHFKTWNTLGTSHVIYLNERRADDSAGVNHGVVRFVCGREDKVRLFWTCVKWNTAVSHGLERRDTRAWPGFTSG